MTDVAATLRAAGMSEHGAAAKERLFARCVEALGGPGRNDSSDAVAESAASGSAVFFVPGRIEVLGKHTDYAGGRSLLCALERGFVVLARPRRDATVRVIDAVRGEGRALPLSPELEIQRADWSAYVAAAVRRVARNFPRARRGADIAFASDLPPASGMSSSSALGIATFLALDGVNELAADPEYRASIDSREALAGYLAAVENGQSFGRLAGDLGVGTFGGSEDHTAILCCRSGMLSRWAFAPVRAEGDIPLPASHTFVVAFSGVAADKGSAAQARYNELSLAVRRIVELWNTTTRRSDRSLADAVESAPDAADRMRGLLHRSSDGDFTPRRLVERLDQFLIESYEIIPQAADALARADFGRVGPLADRSHQCAEAMLHNQIPETMALARMARAEGADAASAFGAGFGGSVWALVAADRAEELTKAWRERYARAFPDAAARAEFIVTRPGPGAVTL